jgi:hypothetical protein
MKTAIGTLAITILLTMFGIEIGTAAEEIAAPPSKVETATVDCSRQVWPHFPPRCLRNADQKIDVRLVTVDRR